MTRLHAFLILAPLSLFALTLLTLPGCNTVKGVGKDIHDAAQNCQTFLEGSEENREYLPADSRSARARP